MVKTEDVPDNWREVFERKRLVPPHSQTVRLAADSRSTQSSGFQLSPNRVTAPHLSQPQDAAEGQDVLYQLRVTLFDRNHHQFFGKTWKSQSERMKNGRISFSEVLYFHTSLRLPSTIVVLELVSLSLKPDGSEQALGRGFAILEVFTNTPELLAADGRRRLNLHQGSPRCLFQPVLKDTLDYDSLLTLVEGAHLECVIKKHPALDPAMHLFPENVFISGDENIPGLMSSPAVDALLKPQLLKMLPFVLHRVTITLQPSLEMFESQLLRLINADYHNTKQPGPEDTLRTVVIQERRLHVGVHNGWCFLEKPQVVVLHPQSLLPRGRADSSFKQSTLLRDSSSSDLQTLGLRSSLELRLANHRAMAIVFQLEYVFSAPIGQEMMLTATSTSRAAFMQSLRWGIWCPFQEANDWNGEEIQLRLHGGAKPNPYGVMVYSSQTSAKVLNSSPFSTPEAAQVSEANDVITFRLSPPSEKSALSPNISLRKRHEDAPHPRKSPTRGQKYVPTKSPPDSPRGPRLSLFQLAASSRYPTISHSSSALPWQQSFPSQLQPSSLALAHQLSHVACPGVSSILHLEADLQKEGNASLSAQDEGELQELPFTPVHAPVITMGTSTPRSSSVSSRSSLAHLYSAGFPPIVDSNGQVAEVLDPTEPLPFDLQCEETDFLQDNLLVFQFLAFTRIPEAGVSRDWPENIYFTFQFYRFPPVTSQQLRLLTSDKGQPKADSPPPCLLASINRDGTVNSASPGLQLQFRVDECFLKPGEKRWFLRYLALHTMHIDIWDSDSLLLIGSTAIELKYMLRQGKSAVQALHEVEVLTTDYVGEETLLMNTVSGRQSTYNHMTVHTVVRGWLHVRTGNIDPQQAGNLIGVGLCPSTSTMLGCAVDPRQKRSADPMPPYSNVITPHAIGAFRGGSLSRSFFQVDGRNSAQADRLERERNQEPWVRTESDDEEHKLERMAAVRLREAPENARVAKVTDQAKEGYRVKSAAELSKAEDITNMLSQDITTQHLLFASLGSAEYMEFVLKNPLNVPQTVTIHSDDPELSVITCTEECRHFKELTKTSTRLEENMFHVEDGAPGPKVYLRPKESVLIPLKYQSFLCDHALAFQGPSFLPPGKGSQVAKKNLSNLIAAKTIKVTFKAEDGELMAVLRVNVEPTPHVVDQTFRLYHPELCFLKKAIRLPPWQDPTAERLDATTGVSVRCSDPNIVCQTRTLVPGEPQDIYLKVPGSPSPNIKMFFVMVFTDKWMAAPSQIWQFYVHFLERVDVSCVAGQKSRQSLVLRGKQAVRKVRCYSSHPQEIKVDPEGVFVLPPAAVQEVHMKVQPWRAGSRFFYLNAVDVEHRRLINSWLVCLNIYRPVLSKTFEVHVPVSGERGCSKKISYTNPYTSRRTFLLRSDHPDLLQFKEDRFQIGGGESYSIGLRFAPSRSSGSVDILVYVNSLEEKTEETFSVKVNYT